MICEFKFLEQCVRDATETVTFGQFNGWTYNYCTKHASLMKDIYKIREVGKNG